MDQIIPQIKSFVIRHKWRICLIIVGLFVLIGVLVIGRDFFSEYKQAKQYKQSATESQKTIDELSKKLQELQTVSEQTEAVLKQSNSAIQSHRAVATQRSNNYESAKANIAKVKSQPVSIDSAIDGDPISDAELCARAKRLGIECAIGQKGK